jgi:hypothetical protein
MHVYVASMGVPGGGGGGGGGRGGGGGGTEGAIFASQSGNIGLS